MKNHFWAVICLFLYVNGFAQQTSSTDDSAVYPLVAKDSLKQKKWVDSLYNSMSLQEKVGQLFMVDVRSDKSRRETDYIKTLIKKYHIGGVIFSKGGPVRQAKLTNAYQKASKTPLLMGQDAEWGLAMRLDSTYAFPWNMTLGAIENKEWIKLTGKQIARQVKRIGMQIDFVPDVDININPDNPIIGNRSFGENKKRVSEKAIAFMQGMESEGVLTSAKHFPGHGDTDVDSHKALPVLNFSRERLDRIEFYPYRKIIPAGISSVMVSHLEVPALDNRKEHPASLSKPIINGILKKEMNFKGLIITDGLNMKGVANHDAPGKTSLDAFLAGNDILLIPRSVPLAVQKITQAYKKGKVTQERLAHSVKKILMAKYKTGLNHFKPVEIKHLVQDLNKPGNDLLYAQLMENAITVIKNNKKILPIESLNKKKIAYVPMGNADGTDFLRMLKKYDRVDKIEATHLNDLLKQLKPYDEVIIGFHKSNASPWKSYKFTAQEKVWLHEIALQHHTILSVFTSPYALLDLRTTTNIDGIVIGYQNSKIAQEKTAQVIFGAIGAKGKLPVSVGKQFPEGTQYKTTAIKRLAYGLPESVGMNARKMKKIDSIAEEAIAKKMTPGMQVLVARKGKVVFQKNYGYQSYDKKQPITDRNVYDLASMTKILATLPLMMQLEEKGDIQLNTTLKEILPFLKNTNKADITLKRALSHYARFKPWIPFYRHTLNDQNEPSSTYYSKSRDTVFTIKVAENLFLRKDYWDTIYQEIADSRLRLKTEYKYSDLPFYLFKRFLENYYDKNLNQLTQSHFYKSLGANYMGYLPLARFKADQIVPAEQDDYYRHQELRGYVDDEGAAMFGGIGGHAGLFANANDVAKMLQMYLNQGTYGGEQYFKPETLKLFNTCNYCDQDVRRGVGFDKPQKRGEIGPVCDQVSRSSFGHTGFTGTIGWVDPQEELIFIVLSNRTYPDRSNRKFIRKDIRTKMQEVVYKAIEEPVAEK